MLINNIKVGYKLVGSIVFVCLMATGVILYGAKLRIELLHKMDSVHGKYEFEIQKIGDIKAGVEKMRGDIYRYVYVPADRQKMVRNLNENMSSINESMQAYKDRNIDAEEKKIIDELDVAWSEMQRGYKEVMTMALEGENNEVDRLLEARSYAVQSGVKTLASINNLNNYITTKNKAIIKANMESSGGLSGAIIILSAMSIGLIIVLVILLSISITQPLKKGVVMMQEMRKGHLSNRLGIKRKDEIGVLANAMDQFADHLQKNVVFNMQQISDGNINIETLIMDERDEIGPAIKRMVETLAKLGAELRELTKSAMEGKLGIRGDEEDFQGAYKDIINGMNKTLDAVIGPVNEASAVLEKVAGKDMTARMKGDYKGDHARIKESLNLAAENLDKALQQVAIGAEQVGAASVQVSTGGQSLSQGASEQASSLEEVSSSLQEMSSMTKQNALNAREAKGVSEGARESADRGVESMNKMSSAIGRIKSSSDATAKIVKTIDEIAFQTNLLALNAAVEAARAGDAGRGFAVVAEEVRNLAMRSAEAAKNTANLIEEAVKNSENGVVINAEVLKNFQEITEKISKVSQVVAEIAAASEQQDQGISQVNKAVEQLNQLTQQNAANAEESASAAEEMSSQSEEMRSMVAGFKVTGSHELGISSGLKQADYMLTGSSTGKKGDKAIAGLHPDPRKVIPLDDKDHDILEKF